MPKLIASLQNYYAICNIILILIGKVNKIYSTLQLSQPKLKIFKVLALKTSPKETFSAKRFLNLNTIYLFTHAIEEISLK